MTKISVSTYNNLKAKKDNFSSWAVWAEPDENAKLLSSNMEDLSIFDDVKILDVLNPNIVLIGYSHSGVGVIKEMKLFENFHSSGPIYKLRYALKGTPLWGAYMTDIIKTIAHPDIPVIEKMLKEDPKEEEHNIDLFVEEFKELKVKNPILVGLGIKTYELLKKYSDDKLSNFKIERMIHYSARGKMQDREKYRVRALQDISQMEI